MGEVLQVGFGSEAQFEFEFGFEVWFEFEPELTWLKIEASQLISTIWNLRSINLYFYYHFSTHAEEGKFTEFKKNHNEKCFSSAGTGVV
jgi:hypothetical protein